MKCIEATDRQELEVTAEHVVHFPLGLLGFETIKKYVMLSKPEEAPFAWLQMLEQPGLAFLVLPASELPMKYNPELSLEDVQSLGLTDPADALVYTIVTLRENNEATANLKGPIVLNRFTLVGKQVVPLNAAQYPLHLSLIQA